MIDEEKETDETSPDEAGDDPSLEGDEETEGGEGEEDKKKSGGKKKLLLFVVLPLLVLIAAGAGLYFTGMLDGILGGGESETETKDGHDTGGHGEKSGDAVFLEIPAMIVNLNSEDGAPRYLRLSVQLELDNEEDLKKVEAVIPRVIDQFQTYLRELRVRDLRGSAGIYRLQMELLWRVNQAAAPVEVKDVLFQEILIQ